MELFNFDESFISAVAVEPYNGACDVIATPNGSRKATMDEYYACMDELRSDVKNKAVKDIAIKNAAIKDTATRATVSKFKK